MGVVVASVARSESWLVQRDGRLFCKGPWFGADHGHSTTLKNASQKKSERFSMSSRMADEPWQLVSAKSISWEKGMGAAAALSVLSHSVDAIRRYAMTHIKGH